MICLDILPAFLHNISGSHHEIMLLLPENFMGKRLSAKQNTNGFILGLEQTLWLAADKLRKNIDAAKGKKVGQFYTPKSIVRLMVEMIEPYRGRVFDLCYGSGGIELLKSTRI
jgi:type I restriction-modification system DNA methylase subunit